MARGSWRSRRVERAWADPRVRTGTALAAGVLALAAVRRLVRARRRIELEGRVAIITGGSRGLGYALARELGRAGARVAICGRSSVGLEWAREELERDGIDVLAVPADVSSVDHVHELVRRTVERWGRIDLLVNNAGIINVGPLAMHTPMDFQEALDNIFWGTVNTTQAVLPHMLHAGFGRIANITSIGARLAMPHLIAYDSAKFAVFGFSQALHAELAPRGIRVTTVVPGLMRTGSFVNAAFKGDHRAEYAWFALAAASPLTAVSARRAARRIAEALRHGEAHVVIGLKARAAEVFAGVFPGATAELLALVNRALPDGRGSRRRRWIGRDSESRVTRSMLTAAGRKAGEDLHQFPDHHLDQVFEAAETLEARERASEPDRTPQ